MPQQFKIHRTLPLHELAALEEFAMRPGTSIDQCQQWLRSRGYEFHRSTIHTWKSTLPKRVPGKGPTPRGELRIEAAAVPGTFVRIVAVPDGVSVAFLIIERKAETAIVESPSTAVQTLTIPPNPKGN
jgi:hypothetical protein